MKVKCINKKCLHEWDYRGQSNNYISCPICHFKFKIQRAINNMLNIPLNIPTNIPTNIPSNIPSNIPIKRVFINKITPEMFDSNDNEEFEEQEELSPEPIKKLCSKHNLPARYNDYDKKWICNECDNLPLLRNVKEVTSHLGTAKEIKSDVEITGLSYDPIKHLEHQMSFF